MKLSAEQEIVHRVFSRTDRNGIVHCRECPMRLDDKHVVCLKIVSKKDALNNWDWNGSEYPAIDRTERRERWMI